MSTGRVASSLHTIVKLPVYDIPILSSLLQMSSTHLESRQSLQTLRIDQTKHIYVTYLLTLDMYQMSTRTISVDHKHDRNTIFRAGHAKIAVSTLNCMGCEVFSASKNDILSAWPDHSSPWGPTLPVSWGKSGRWRQVGRISSV